MQDEKERKVTENHEGRAGEEICFLLSHQDRILVRSFEIFRSELNFYEALIINDDRKSFHAYIKERLKI